MLPLPIANGASFSEPVDLEAEEEEGRPQVSSLDSPQHGRLPAVEPCRHLGGNEEVINVYWDGDQIPGNRRLERAWDHCPQTSPRLRNHARAACSGP